MAHKLYTIDDQQDQHAKHYACYECAREFVKFDDGRPTEWSAQGANVPHSWSYQVKPDDLTLTGRLDTDTTPPSSSNPVIVRGHWHSHGSGKV